jgi:hypothetical protein
MHNGTNIVLIAALGNAQHVDPDMGERIEEYTLYIYIYIKVRVTCVEVSAIRRLSREAYTPARLQSYQPDRRTATPGVLFMASPTAAMILTFRSILRGRTLSWPNS